MSKNAPLVSVIMPAYNAEEYVGEAIDSVLAQTYKELELLVIDDGSTDKTPGIIKAYKDSRVRYYRVNRLGVSGARNFGLSKAKGAYVAFCDSDDAWIKDKLTTQLAVMDEASVCVSRATFVGGANDGESTMDLSEIPQEPKLAWRRLVKGNFVNLSSLVAPLKNVIEAGGFNEGLHFAEDYNLSMKLTHAGLPIKVINEPLLRYRVLGSGLSNNPNQELIIAQLMYAQLDGVDRQDRALLLKSGKRHLKDFLRMRLGTDQYDNFRENLKIVHGDMPRSVLKWGIGVYLRSRLLRSILALIRNMLTKGVRLWWPKN